MDLRDLPSVESLANDLAPAFPALPRALVVDLCRRSIDDAREHLRRGDAGDPSSTALERLSEVEASRPRRVINATGVLLHTNLGRANAPKDAAIVLARLTEGSGNVELDLRTGRRTRRDTYLEALIVLATGAEAGFAVNNNAGALLLAMATVAGDGGSVAVSRGELIEIGGSFRLPELMRSSGATLIEVGTTNRTRLGDYEAVADSVAAILKVHPSNYRVEGFHEDALAADLAELAARHSIPFIHDVGSGLLDVEAPWLGDVDRSWLTGEPGVRQSVEDGADLVLFSGDKLLGGPQAGLLVGKRDAVEAARRHPMARAVRLDGGSIAALAATLELYIDHRVLDVPFWRMASTRVDEISKRSMAVIRGLDRVTIEDGASVPGAGSVPGRAIPTKTIRIEGDADNIWRHLATRGEEAVIGTRRSGAVYLDLRSVAPEDDAIVRGALEAALA